MIAHRSLAKGPGQFPNDDTTRQPAVSRQQLLELVLAGSEPGAVAVRYPYSRLKDGEGWIYGARDCQRAILAWKDGTLAAEVFATNNQTSRQYTIRGANRLGIVPHRNGQVTRVCFDFDDHKGDGGNVHAADRIATFLGARPVRFTSRSGKGIHDFYGLTQPMAIDCFLEWVKGWGFNAGGDVEVFPKTAKLTTVWMPNEPGIGDRYVGGTVDECRIELLPPPPSKPLCKAHRDFMRGLTTCEG